MGDSAGHKLRRSRQVRSVVAMVMTVSILLLAPVRPALAAARQTGGPSAYRLTVAGTVGSGATVVTTVDDFVSVGLVVTSDDSDLAAPSALVPLGQVDPGNRTLSWNLKVNGQTLGAGQYVVALEVFTATGQPSGRPFPPPAILTVRSDGHTSVAMTSPSSTKTNWLATIIAVIVALAAGVVAGFFLGRRTHAERKGAPTAGATA
jgi:hypothetical protein